MRRSLTFFIILAVLAAGPLAASAQDPEQIPPPATPKAAAPKPDQQPAPAPGQARPEATPVPVVQPKPAGQPVNVRLDLTITDQIGSAAPVQKVVSLLIADQGSGMIRSEGQLPGYGAVQLHVDGEVRLSQGDKIRARVGLNYDLIDPKAKSAEAQSQRTQIRESLSVILENGKPTVISQSADPVTDRKVTVEVKATIVK
jgi:hypothetical protein